MQRFKDQSAKPFPSHGDVLRVAFSLGYRKAVLAETDPDEPADLDGTNPTGTEVTGSPFEID